MRGVTRRGMAASRHGVARAAGRLAAATPAIRPVQIGAPIAISRSVLPASRGRRAAAFPRERRPDRTGGGQRGRVRRALRPPPGRLGAARPCDGSGGLGRRARPQGEGVKAPLGERIVQQARSPAGAAPRGSCPRRPTRRCRAGNGSRRPAVPRHGRHADATRRSRRGASARAAPAAAPPSSPGACRPRSLRQPSRRIPRHPSSPISRMRHQARCPCVSGPPPHNRPVMDLNSRLFDSIRIKPSCDEPKAAAAEAVCESPGCTQPGAAPGARRAGRRRASIGASASTMSAPTTPATTTSTA